MLSLRKRTVPALLLSAVCIILLYSGWRNSYQIKNVISYATRPLWDTPDGPKELITHYASAEVPIDAHACALSGWKLRKEPVELFDAVIVSSELDLLEVRLHELDGLVDQIFIVESDSQSCQEHLLHVFNHD